MIVTEAANTGEFINGESLWEITDVFGIVDTVTVHPFFTIADAVAVWIRFQH